MFAVTNSANPDGIWIIDSSGATLYASAAMGEILGVDPASLNGQSSFDYVFPEDLDAARVLFDSKSRGETSPFHFRLKRKDGSAIWVDILGTPMHNVAGEFLGIVGTFRLSAQHSWEQRKAG